MLRYFGIAVAALVLSTAGACAQDKGYPSRLVRIIAPFGAGGGGDVLTRIIAQSLSEKLGQPFIVENKAGANGIIGAREALNAAPDGYTLLLATTTTMVINQALTKDLPYDPVRDFVAISQLTTVPYVLVASAEIPVDSVRGFIDYARKSPTPLSYASGSTPAIIAGAMFSQKADLKTVHVPYKATVPALTDVIAGHVAFMFSDFAPALEQMKSGKIRALAVTMPNRSALLPDVPSLAETLPGFEIIGWVGLCARAGVPKEVVDRLNGALKETLASDDIKKKILMLGMEPTYSTPEQYAALIKSDTGNWTRLAKIAGIEPQ